LKKFFILFSIVLLFLIGIIIFRSQFFRISANKALIDQYKRELSGLGQAPLKSWDMPISAIIIYNYNVIGRGFNTVVRDSNAGGHAVINAISDAIRNVGLETFMILNRDSLKLITTYEPCPMCKGALYEYKIEDLEFLKSKSLSFWLNESYSDFIYEMKKRKLDNSEIQDSLFKLHPAYKQELPDF
jgi:tRNA(Arg) A34 adenosine deaminase TadA